MAMHELQDLSRLLGSGRRGQCMFCRAMLEYQDLEFSTGNNNFFLKFQSAMLFCDSCDKGYHMGCHVPPVSEKPLGMNKKHEIQVMYLIA